MTEEKWSYLVGRAGAVLNYGIEEKEWLKAGKMARLVAAVPFLAGCDKAEETAFSHLMIYLISLDESAKDIFFHRPFDDEDIYMRLFPVSNFLAGDAEVIRCCLDLMALTMLAGYKRDAEEDEKLGKYNPLNAGKWDYDREAKKLEEKIQRTSRPEIAEFYSLDDALKGYWKS